MSTSELHKCRQCGAIAQIVDYEVNPNNKSTIAIFRCPRGHEFKKRV